MAAELRWRLDTRGSGDGEPVAVARSDGGVLATGGTRGVTLRHPDGTRRFSLRAPVEDLAFDAGERLFAATPSGLFQIDRTALTPRDVSPPGGERARDIERLAVAGPEVAVATEAGVFWRRGAAPWRRVDAAAEGEEPARALAIVLRGDQASRLWIGSARGLFVAEPASGLPARVHPLPEAPGEVIDLFWDGHTLYVLTDDSLVSIDGTTRVERLQAAPGAQRHRIARGPSGFFLATERGLWRAAAAAGPWLRAEDPAGRAAWTGLAVWDDGAALAGRRGLLLASEVSSPLTGVRVSETHSCAPSIGEVQGRVLATLRLAGDPVERMRRGVRRRGWLPTLRIAGNYRVDEEWNRDFDQSFVSGGLRELRDWDRDDRNEREIGAVISWDFGDLLYHPEEIDVSTEGRRLIELRDDILDEVNQLYFDRERVLGEGGDPYRAAHLAAGLDAWTGGWFSEAQGSCPPPSQSGARR